MSDETETYQDILQENFYLFCKFLVAEDFLEQLISDEILTLDDKEVICNRVVHQNRRQRTSKLIEILMTRGERGYEKFLDILEFQYPHVYKTVTNKEPRDPPSDFHRTRFSDRLRMIHELPHLLEHMKDQVVANTELDSQLSVLQQLLHVSKDENLALEKEVELLKDVRQENMDLRIKLKTMELKDHESQVAISEWSQKSYQLLESVNEFKEKCHSLQVKYDDLLKSKSPSSNAADNVVEARKPAEPHQCSVDNAPHYKARLEILQHELESHKQQCEDMTTRLQRSEDMYQHLEEEHEQLKKELKRLTREKNNLETQSMDYSVKVESYYKTIQKKNEEILQLQHKRVEEQRHVTDLNHEKNELFEKNHRLEEQVQALKADNEKIKARLSIGSRSSQEYTGSSMDQSNGSSASDGDLVEDAPKVNRKIQRRKVVKKSNSADKYSDRLASLDREFSKYSKDISDSIGDGDIDNRYKASTLPSLASDTPEQMFRREVAHFRYSRRNTETSSIRAHHGSQIERDPGAGFVQVKTKAEGVSNLSLDSSIKRVARSHPSDSNDVDDNVSDSTVYVSRSPHGSNKSNRLSRQEGLEETSFSSPAMEEGMNRREDASVKRSDSSLTLTQGREKGKSGGIPTGGKKYTRRRNDSSQDLEGPAQCDSIIDRSDFSDEGSLVTSDFSSYDVHTALLAKDRLVVNRPVWTDRNMSRCVKVKYSMLKDIEFIGGNHTGIFISKACKPLELNEGEQVEGVSITPQERLNPIRTSLKGCTLQDFLLIVKGDLINKKKEREIVLEVKNSRQEYLFACEWMKNNNGHGDYFFVRCNADIDRKRDDGVSLRPGEVFLVKNSCHEGDQWLCHMVDPVTGKMSMTSSIVPNCVQANVRRLSTARSMDEEEKIKRGGFKVKGVVYDRVLPMKACVKLPVLIIGPNSQLVSAFLNLIDVETSDKFAVEMDHTDNSCPGDLTEDSETFRHDIHIVKEGRLESLKSRSVQRINVFLNVTTELSSTGSMKLFGSYFDGIIGQDVIAQSMFIKQKLQDSRQKFEEISIPLVNTKDNLMKTFQKCVTAAQDRLLWSSYAEIDQQAAAKYSSYLGQHCDLCKLLQRSQNFESS